MNTQLTLQISQEPLAICRLEPGAPLPEWALQGTFVSVTRTSDELSLVCRHDVVPPNVTCEPGWRALKVAGPLDFALTGILASLAVPLAEAGISIFAISTYDTDYVLLKEQHLQQALEVLQAAGHTVALGEQQA
jgi:hypothetical protein